MDKYPIQCGVEILLKNKIIMTTGCYLENQFGEGRRGALNHNFPNNLQFHSIYSYATCTW